MTGHTSKEIVVNTLRHANTEGLPRGELFFSSTFLDIFFPRPQGDYVGQVASAAALLGLSVVGVDLNKKWSLTMLRRGEYWGLQEYFTVGYINGPVSRTIAQLGFRQAMVSIKRNNKTLHELAMRLNNDVEEICILARENGISAIMLADDIAGNRGLLFSQNDFFSAILPYYAEIAQIIKKGNLYAFFHSDGDTRAIIESLIKSGYDCIHPIDSQAGLSLYALKDAYKDRASFMGHIDIITWDDDRIAREVVNAEEAFRTGGLILGSTCGLSMKTASNKMGALYPQWHMGGQGT